MTRSDKKILVVEDEPDIRLNLTTLLSANGYGVDEAEDGQVALDRLAAGQRYDVMILDLMMPNVDGYAVLERMDPGQLEKLSVIVLTAKNQDEDILQGYIMGATYYVTKPYENSAVLNIVRYLVGDLSEDQKRHLEKHL
jgi:DNA-binding response OmpR family regulator